ncbi:hypothetical protein ACSSS7_000850 [Eimeria intestinalis]
MQAQQTPASGMRSAAPTAAAAATATAAAAAATATAASEADYWEETLLTPECGTRRAPPPAYGAATSAAAAPATPTEKAPRAAAAAAASARTAAADLQIPGQQFVGDEEKRLTAGPHGSTETSTGGDRRDTEGDSSKRRPHTKTHIPPHTTIAFICSSTNSHSSSNSTSSSRNSSTSSISITKEQKRAARNGCCRCLLL